MLSDRKFRIKLWILELFHLSHPLDIVKVIFVQFFEIKKVESANSELIVVRETNLRINIYHSSPGAVNRIDYQSGSQNEAIEAEFMREKSERK